MLPSPTPDATRLTEPWRTSPAAKMPGTLVSSRNGSRSSGHAAFPARDQVHHVAAGADITVLVADHRRGQPVGLRVGADEHEHGGRGFGDEFSGVAVLDDDGLEVVFAFDADDPASCAYLDVALGRQLLDQVMRHASAPASARAPAAKPCARNWRRTSRPVRRNCRRRPGTRAGPGNSSPRCAPRRSRCRGRPAHRRPGRRARRHETPDARITLRAATRSPPSSTHGVPVGCRRGLDSHHVARDQQFRAEPPRLLQRSRAQFLARHAGGKPKVILDARRRAGLAAGRFALDQDRSAVLPTRHRRPPQDPPGPPPMMARS